MTYMQFAASLNPKKLKCRKCNNYFSFGKKNMRFFYFFAAYALVFGFTLAFLGDYAIPLTFWQEVVISVVVLTLIGLPMETYFWLSKDFVKRDGEEKNS